MSDTNEERRYDLILLGILVMLSIAGIGYFTWQYLLFSPEDQAITVSPVGPAPVKATRTTSE